MAVRLTENTVIAEADISSERYRSFFRKAIVGFSPEIYCGAFQHWLNQNNCKMRKTYVINGDLIEKCSGVVFEFHQPDMEKLPDYINLLKEFYTRKK